MLNEKQQKTIRSIFSGPQITVLRDYAEEMIQKWREERVCKNTEFETFKTLAKSQGKEEGLREFFMQLEHDVLTER